MSNKMALDALKPCPFCGGDVMHRHALWPSDGDTDSVIHAQGSTCGMGCFSIGTADQGVSVAAAWNARAAIAALQAEPQPANEREAALWRMVTANPQRAANLLSSWCDDGEATIEELEAAMAKD